MAQPPWWAPLSAPRSVLPFLLCSLALATTAPLLSGCEKDKPAQPPQDQKAMKPTVRLYAVAGAAGAIEPCGCVKDMLGGIDHAAAFIASQKDEAPHSLVLGAGPMFFPDPTLDKDGREQALFKAEAMAASLKDLKLEAWAPGANDWADGSPYFKELLKKSGAKALAGNLPSEAGPLSASHVVERNGVKIGLVGVSLPKDATGKTPFTPSDAAKALARGAAEVKKGGAQIAVALIAAQRGEALRLIENHPEFQLAIVGKGYDQGESNDPPFAPEVIGKTLVVQAPNHLQGVSVIDLYVRDNEHVFQDGSGIENLARSTSLKTRVEDLTKKIAGWKKKKTIAAEDLKAQETKLKSLKQELSELSAPQAPKKGSYFLYDLVEIKESQGQDKHVASRLVAYYKRVNEYNKTTYAELKPEPAPEGTASYIGVEACSSCHLEERAFWNKTAHAGAYETLSTQHKEFNLDCVSCHVTGYDKPGGSTVTHVEGLSDVQCEVCHGPGSLHRENPGDAGLIRPAPDRSLCASACHHSPHVGSDWSVEEAWPHIIGPGHGK